MNNESKRKIESSAVFVLAICLPLFISLLFSFFPDMAIISVEKLQIITVGYSVALLSFFAGTRYGAILNGAQAKTAWIIPFAAGPVFAIAIFLLPYSLALAVLAAGFGAQGAWDSWAGFRGKLPRDYSNRRTMLTGLICSVLIAILIVNGLG